MQRLRLRGRSDRISRGWRTDGGAKTTRQSQVPKYYAQVGVSASRELYDWHRAVLQGQIQRKTGVIILLDDSGAQAVRWVFTNAWPSKWEGPDLCAKGNDVAIETLVITCESIELVS